MPSEARPDTFFSSHHPVESGLASSGWTQPRAGPFHRNYKLEEDSGGPVPSGGIWSPIGQNVLNSDNKVHRVTKKTNDIKI